MFDNSIVRKSNQLWKLFLSFTLSTTGFVAMAVGISLSDRDTSIALVYIVLSGICLGILGFILAAYPFVTQCASPSGSGSPYPARVRILG